MREHLTDLTAEIETARRMLDIAVANGSASLANTLLVTISKLATAIELSAVRFGETIPRSRIAAIGDEVGKTLAAVLRERNIPNWEDIVVETAERIGQVIDDLPRLEHTP